MWNKAKCILLETKENSGLLLGLSRFGRLISYDTESVNPNNDVYNAKQHLYIINNDVIKEGDWFIRLFDNTVTKANVNSDHKHYDCKKIIATTDKSLVVKYDERFTDVTINNNSLNQLLPQISQQFIEQYITEYNQGNTIVDVLVEYEQNLKEIYDLSDQFSHHENHLKLKINQDNTINIKTVKDSFSREDMIDFAWWFVRNAGQYSDDRIAHLEGKYLDKYLQNL